MLISSLVGVGLLIGWSVKTELGTKALLDIPLRRSTMPVYYLPFLPSVYLPYIPFVLIFGWLGLTVTASELVDTFTAGMPEWRQSLVLYLTLAAIEVTVGISVIFLAKKYFVDGLAGFGLWRKKIFSDMASAAGILVAVWPVVMVGLFIVMGLGRLFAGDEFQMPKNEGLLVILEYDQWPVRILMILFATVITPIFEEMVFRGILQSSLRSIDVGPWQSIFITSLVFSMLHPSMHFPAILALSIAMGYAYEKSGSLFRSIFIHIFFNASTVAFALLGV